jgi:predicted acylesterase/phospholipase RssA
MPTNLTIHSRKNLTINTLSNVENLIFQGGGVKGTAYLGAMEVLLNTQSKSHIKLSQIKRVGGASAGAITALLLALGKGLDELTTLINGLELKSLLDEGDVVKGFNLRDTVLKFLEIYSNAKDNDFLDFSTYFIYQSIKIYGYDYLGDAIVKNKAIDLLKNHIGVHGLLTFFDNLTYNVLSNKLKKFYKGTKSYIDDIVDMFMYKFIELCTKVNLENTEQKILLFFNNENEEKNNFNHSVYRIVQAFMTGARGVFPGDKFLEWIENELEKAELSKDITFKEFKLKQIEFRSKGFKDLYIVGLNLSNGITQIFSHEKTPNVLVCDAVRVSMSIPYFFELHGVREKTSNNELVESNVPYVDGGVLDNYPIWMFDSTRYLKQKLFFTKQIRTFTIKTH